MPRGGQRPGAGRKPGGVARPHKAVGKKRAATPSTARTKGIAVVYGDILPAEVLLTNMRRVYARAAHEEAKQLRLSTSKRDLSLADKLYNVAQVYAVDAAPYYHPKLAALAAMRPPDPTATSLEQMILASMGTPPANQNAPELPAPDDGLLIDLEAVVKAAE